MKDINKLIIDENSITNSLEEDFEILSEWSVDPKKKLASDACCCISMFCCSYKRDNCNFKKK